MKKKIGSKNNLNPSNPNKNYINNESFKKKDTEPKYNYDVMRINSKDIIENIENILLEELCRHL